MQSSQPGLRASAKSLGLLRSINGHPSMFSQLSKIHPTPFSPILKLTFKSPSPFCIPASKTTTWYRTLLSNSPASWQQSLRPSPRLRLTNATGTTRGLARWAQTTWTLSSSSGTARTTTSRIPASGALTTSRRAGPAGMTRTRLLLSVLRGMCFWRAC